MGYLLNSIGNLPIDDTVSLYIFVVNGEWRGEPYDTFDKNFNRLAQQIGESAVIAKGFEPQTWTSEIAKAYFGKHSGELFKALPGLLLTDTHPEQLKEDSLRLIVPLRKIKDHFIDWDDFFRSLTEFSINKDPEFLERFKEKDKALNTANKIINLKPNFFGIGINLNAAIEKWRS